MFWVFFAFLVAAEAAKLDNTYLPPPHGAKESGGSDGALQVPLEPPYVDQYTPTNVTPQSWRPGTRALRPRAQPDDKFLENEDEITVPKLEKGRFISGSYSYTGPDNVLVTVTYKADDRRGRQETNQPEETVEEEVEAEKEEEEEEIQQDSVAEDEDDDSIVPTPPSLPAELARAFDFHKNKHLAEEEKTNRPKKPIRKTHKNKGQHGNQYGMKLHPHKDHGHQYPPQASYGPPTIHQGYSYPKQS